MTSRLLVQSLVLAPLVAGGVPAWANAQTPTPPVLAGTWILGQDAEGNPFRGATVRFADNGSFTLAQNGEDWIAGTYSLAEDRLTFLDRTGRFACLWEDGSPKVGTYAWKVTDGRIRLSLIDDDCDGRVATLAISWLSQPESDGK